MNTGRSFEAGISPEELVTFNYTKTRAFGDAGRRSLCYGRKPEAMRRFVDKMERFVRASMKGWKYAEENQEEAAEIVLEFDDATGAQD